ALARDWERGGEAARRKRIAVGEACCDDSGTHRRAARSDLEGDAGGTAEATDPNQPECSFAVFWATPHHLQKKACKPRSESGPMWPARGGVGYDSKACLIQPGWCLSTRPG